MVDYKKGKIYQIKNTIDDDIYVGSTTNTLEGRMKGHKGSAQYTKCKQHCQLYKKMNEYGFDKFFVELIEEAHVILNLSWEQEKDIGLGKEEVSLFHLVISLMHTIN